MKKTRVMRLRNVYNGRECVHTGDTIMHGKRIPSPFPFDKDLKFIKTCDSHQVTDEGNEVILAPNDLVRVI